MLSHINLSSILEYIFVVSSEESLVKALIFTPFKSINWARFFFMLNALGRL